MLYRIKALGKIVSLTVGKGRLERLAVYASVDDEIEATDSADAYRELEKRIYAQFERRYSYFDHDDWDLINWEIVPTVRPIPEATLLERAGYPTLFAMENV